MKCLGGFNTVDCAKKGAVSQVCSCMSSVKTFLYKKKRNTYKWCKNDLFFTKLKPSVYASLPPIWRGKKES